MIEKYITYRITDQVLLNISEIERNLAILHQSEIAHKSHFRVLSESLFDDMFAVASFLNLHLTLGDIKKITVGKEVSAQGAVLLSNIRQIFDFIRNNYRKNQIVFNFYLVQHIVKLLQTNILEVWDIGKIRSTNDSVFSTYELQYQNYEKSADISHTLAEAILWVENDQSIHPIVKACVFLVFLNTVSPFIGLNYVGSLLFFRLILEKYGYGHNFYIPLFKSLSHANSNAHVQITKSMEMKQPDITELLENITTCLKDIILTYKKDLIEFDYYDVKNNSQKLDLNERQVKLLTLLQQKVFIKRREYIKLFKVSPMTAYRDLNYLTEKSLVVVGGKGKSTTYTLATKC